MPAGSGRSSDDSTNQRAIGRFLSRRASATLCSHPHVACLLSMWGTA